MKTTIRLSSILLLIASFPSLALSATYAYNAGVPDWYTATKSLPAFTKYTDLPQGITSPFSTSGYEAQIRVNISQAGTNLASLVGELVGANGAKG